MQPGLDLAWAFPARRAKVNAATFIIPHLITEPLALYEGGVFDGRALPATQVVRAIVPAERKLTEVAHAPFVGLYGGIEIQNVDGPLLADTDYEVDGEIVGLSDSPQTEIVWWRFDLYDGNRLIATVLKMDRVMKSSSPLWRANET